MTIRQKLEAGFSALQRPVDEVGFWDEQTGTFARARRGVRGELGVEAPDLRYTPFGLAGALRAHRQSGVGDATKLRRASQWALTNVPATKSLDDLFYGGVWSLVEAAITWQDEEFSTLATKLASERAELFNVDPSLNLGVGLFALAELSDYVGTPTVLREIVAQKSSLLASAVNERGVPATGDRRAAYHQRMMYCTWGLARAASVLADHGLADAARRILTRVATDRIDEDAGIRWHAILERTVSPDGGAKFYPWGHHIYYECHQCFYANAVELYEAIAGDRQFHELRARALDFIFGSNRWGTALDEHGVPGLPARCIAKDGNISLWRNKFKGCYEIGAYLWALSSSVRHDASSLG